MAPIHTLGAADSARPRAIAPLRRRDRLPRQPHPQPGPLTARPGTRRADGEPGLRHVAPGSGLLVPARPFRRLHAGRARSGDGRAALKPDIRTRLWTNDTAGG